MEFRNSEMYLPEYGVVKTDNFGKMYPIINDYILTHMPDEESRAGNVKEVLDMKTIITCPYRRCVGGYGRDINVFFLLAEAMWIVLGRKDVRFLTIFNSKMSDFSDDGLTFHAPYGFRLRHWGIRTEDQYENGVAAAKGYDQVADAIRLLFENPNTRQVVMSIWNPQFDLGSKSRDIPCNDMVMLKIRDGKLMTTIQNRSNDLHWGLPTNVFQFSFLTEIMSCCLGIELGTQVHNSQSLHIYDWNGTAKKMNQEFYNSEVGQTLYELGVCDARPMTFDFKTTVPINRFREVEMHLNIVVDNLERINDGETVIEDDLKQVAAFSPFLYNVYRLLKIYVQYKHKTAVCKGDEEKDACRHTAIAEIQLLEAEGADGWDMSTLGKNFFWSKLKKLTVAHDYLGKL